MSFVILSQPLCPYCTMAQNLLDKHNLDYQVRSVSDKPWLKTLMAKANLKTVPQIFRPDGELIGGFNELRVYLNESE